MIGELLHLNLGYDGTRVSLTSILHVKIDLLEFRMLSLVQIQSVNAKNDYNHFTCFRVDQLESLLHQKVEISAFT